MVASIFNMKGNDVSDDTGLSPGVGWGSRWGSRRARGSDASLVYLWSLLESVA